MKAGKRYLLLSVANPRGSQSVFRARSVPLRPRHSERRRLLCIRTVRLLRYRPKREAGPLTLDAGPRASIHRPYTPPPLLIGPECERVCDCRKLGHDVAHPLRIRTPSVLGAAAVTVNFDTVASGLRHTGPRKPDRPRIVGEHRLIARSNQRRRRQPARRGHSRVTLRAARQKDQGAQHRVPSLAPPLHRAHPPLLSHRLTGPSMRMA